MSQSLSTVNPDFADLVVQFQAKLASVDAWRDLLTTATGQTLIEFIAGVGELDQYAIERIFQEMFTETARLDSSIYGITKMLGVRIGRKIPAVTVVEGYSLLNPTPTYGLKRINSLSYPITSPFTIPPYSQFTSDKGLLFNREAILFDANVAYGYQLDSSSNYKDIELYEGTVNTLNFFGTGTDFFSILSAEENFTVADQDVVVLVNAVAIPRQTQGLWNNPNSAPGWQDITTSKGQLQVLFGTKVTGGITPGFGTVPNTGDTITVKYVTTKGAAGNAVFNSDKTSCSTYSGLIDTNQSTLVNELVDGADEPAAEIYQRISPRMFAADQGERGVTQPDYNVVALGYPGVIDARILGQRDTFPTKPSYLNALKIIKYPKPGMSPSEQAAYMDFIQYMEAHTMYSMRFWPLPGEALYGQEPYDLRQFTSSPGGLDLQADVYCNSLADLNNVLNSFIKPALQGLLDEIGGTESASRISRPVFRSDIIDTIKNSHESIDYVVLNEPTVDLYPEVVVPTPTLTGSAGGSLTPLSTYYYYFSAVTANPVGETAVVGPIPITLSAGNTRVTLNWVNPPNHAGVQYTGWNVYRRNTLLSNPALLLTVAPISATSTSYVDNVAVQPGGAMPVADTSGVHIVRLIPSWYDAISTKIRMYYTGRDPV